MTDHTPRHGRCLTDLELAELVAGRLEGKARELAQRHLVECETCYELYEEAQALLEEADLSDLVSDGVQRASPNVPASPVPPLLAFPGAKRSGPWTAWAIAASLLVGIGLAMLVPNGPEPPVLASRWPAFGPLAPSRLATSVLSPLPSARTDRGVSSVNGIAGDFRLGATLVHLEAAARSGELESARKVVAEMRPLIAQRLAAREISSELGIELEAALSALETSADIRGASQLEPAVVKLAGEMTERGYEFDLGRFAEAGRLAALAGDADWFAPGTAAETYLQALRALEADRLSAKARRGLDAIELAWPRQGAETNLEPVARAFEELIRSYDEE